MLPVLGLENLGLREYRNSSEIFHTITTCISKALDINNSLLVELREEGLFILGQWLKDEEHDSAIRLVELYLQKLVKLDFFLWLPQHFVIASKNFINITWLFFFITNESFCLLLFDKVNAKLKKIAHDFLSIYPSQRCSSIYLTVSPVILWLHSSPETEKSSNKTLHPQQRSTYSPWAATDPCVALLS